MRTFGAALGAAVLSVGLAVVGAPAASAHTTMTPSTVVQPGQSIQAAIDAAAPGTTIEVRPGTYRENLEVTKDGISLVGYGATLVPPATARPNFCADPSDPSAVSGICIHGDVEFGDAGATVHTPVHNVSVIGMTVNGFSGIGIFVIGGFRTWIAGNTATGNGAYGIFVNSSSQSAVYLNAVANSAEAGIYVGDSPEANARVFANYSSGNFMGVFVRSAEHATLGVNRLHDNCVGVLVLADNPGPAGASAIMGNVIERNTKACPATDEGPALSGIGVALFGAHDVDIFDNQITKNVPSGATAFSGGVVLAKIGATAPSNNRVRGNLIRENQTDIFSDGSGTGNVLTPNLCETSDPAGLCRGEHF